MNRKEYRDYWMKDNPQHNMFIHGYLQSCQNYVCAFGLESTAAYILYISGINKEDFIRCQLENGHQNELMLQIIEMAFKINSHIPPTKQNLI